MGACMYNQCIERALTCGMYSEKQIYLFSFTAHLHLFTGSGPSPASL